MPATEHHGRIPRDPIALVSAQQNLERRAGDLASCHADLHDRVRRLERNGVDLPPPLRRALAEFSEEVDAVRAELDGL